MLLVIEVGNTNTKIGVYDGPRLLASWRLTTPARADRRRVRRVHPDPARARAASSSSTSRAWPSPTWCRRSSRRSRRCADAYFGMQPFTVEPGGQRACRSTSTRRSEVGPTACAISWAASRSTARPLIVVDFGTATTFDCVNARGEFVGGAIAPGLITAVGGAGLAAARLYRVELRAAQGRHRPQHHHEHPVGRHVRLGRARRRARRAHARARWTAHGEGGGHGRPGGADARGLQRCMISSIPTSRSRDCA